jgi:hypothetical protein
VLWRFGVPAVLMVAFAVTGLLTDSGRDEVAAPAGRGGGAARVSLEPGAASLRPVAAREEPAPPAAGPDDGELRSGPFEVAADEPEASTPRLPSELAPVAPDVIVALEAPARPDVVVAHAHLPGGVRDDAGHLMLELAAQAGDDFQGPEPGAWYWFGPRGLERVRVLGEAGG